MCPVYTKGNIYYKEHRRITRHERVKAIFLCLHYFRGSNTICRGKNQDELKSSSNIFESSRDIIPVYHSTNHGQYTNIDVVAYSTLNLVQTQSSSEKTGASLRKKNTIWFRKTETDYSIQSYNINIFDTRHKLYLSRGIYFSITWWTNKVHGTEKTFLSDFL